MDESAIRLIQETAVTADDKRNSRLPDGVVALPATHTIVDLERFEPFRNRFRGVMSTASLADFVAYVKKNAIGNTAVEGFIDAESFAATVFFNLHEAEKAGHADWQSVLRLKRTAAYTALLQAEGKAMTQRQLIELIEDWNRNFVGFVGEGGDAIPLSNVIDAVRKIEIKSKKDSTHVEQTRRAARTAMEEVEASAGPSLPDRLIFACTPYLGLDEREFALRLSVLTDHDDPRMVLRIASKEEHEEAIAQNFKAVLIEEIGDAAALTIGSFKP